MALEVAVSPITREITCKPGKTQSLTFDISTDSDTALRIGVESYGDRNEWVKVADDAHKEFDLPPKGQEKIMVNVTVPADAQPSSDSVRHSFKLRVYNAHKLSEAVESDAIAVRVPKEQAVVEEEEEEKGETNWLPIIIAAAVGGVVLIGGIVGLLFFLLGGTSVPDFVGQSAQEAAQWFDENDFPPPSVLEEATGEQEPGLVVRQDPEPGADMPEDGVVELVIEHISVAVPSLRGLTIGAAETELTNAGLVLGELEAVETGNFPGGAVIGQEPAADDLAIPGMAVNVTVEKELVRVPGLVGQTFSAAKSMLESNGLIGSKRGEVSEGGQPGTVAQQAPEEGAMVDRGTTVEVDLVAQQIPVPRVIGETLESAAATIVSAQLGLAPVQRTFRGSQAVGRVEAQDPPANSRVPVGSQVTLSVRSRPVIQGEILQSIDPSVLFRQTVRTPFGVRSVPEAEE